MEFLTNDRIKLNYTDQGSGQPIVLLTGIGGHKAIWQIQIDFLIENGYRVINIDARNQGISERTLKGRRIFRHAQDVYELIESLKLVKPIFMGNSMGAATFMAYFALYSDQNCKAFIDVDQSPKMLNDDNWQFGFKDLDWDNFHYLLNGNLGKSTHKPIDDQLYLLMQELNESHPYSFDNNLPLLKDHALQDWRDVLAHLKVPYLIVAGENSPYFDPKFAELVASLNKQGTFAIIKNAGHIVMAEQPSEFNRVLLKFLQTLPQ